MAEVQVNAGVCGLNTTIKVETTGMYQAKIELESQCKHVTKLAEKINELGPVDAMAELFKKDEGKLLPLCRDTLAHLTCPVSIGILKAVEATAGLALPKDASITFVK